MRPYHLAWILCFVALTVFAVVKFGSVPSSPDDASYAASAVVGTQVGGEFTLTDHEGRTVTDKSWPGKYLLVYFGFTHCPDICPVGLTRITEALNKLPKETKAAIQPLFITVDPARDTQETMKNYVILFDKSLVGLTGTDEQIAHVEKLYRVYAQKEGTGDDYMVNHSGYTYLMTPQGNLATVFAHETTADEMAEKLKESVKNQ